MEAAQPEVIRPPPEGPNFVIVLVDDHAHDAMRHRGRYPFLETPNLDRLARQGTSFHESFVTTSLCGPSRACFLTGAYARQHGVAGNNGHSPSLPQFPQLLQGAGYRTAWVGKWHLGSAAPQPGFGHWVSFEGQGRYEDPLLNVNGREVLVEGHITDILTAEAIRWLREHRDEHFALVLSHKAIHGPFTPTSRRAESLDDVELPEPESFADSLAGKPAWLRRGVLHGTSATAWAASEGKDIPTELGPAGWDPRDELRLDYFRSVGDLDESVGQVLDTLDELGVRHDTVVVYTSDNGYFLGEHRLRDKRLMYEESIRVPLILSRPGAIPEGTVVNEMVLNIDLAPTFLDLAGQQIPVTMQGWSLRPLLEGDPATPFRTSFLYEYQLTSIWPGIPTILGVRTSNHKLISYPDVENDVDELYELDHDPLELVNRYDDPNYGALRDDLLAELRDLDEHL